MNEKRDPTFTEVYETKPEGFQVETEVVACFVEVSESLLLLQCSNLKVEEGRWSVPAGKVEKGECITKAAQRELFEETGIKTEHSQLKQIGSLYMRKPHIGYVFHLFKVEVNQKQTVSLSEEHVSHQWVKPEELSSLPLMSGAQEALAYYHLATGKRQKLPSFLFPKRKKNHILRQKKF